jgi:hypothetical protein
MSVRLCSAIVDRRIGTPTTQTPREDSFSIRIRLFYFIRIPVLIFLFVPRRAAGTGLPVYPAMGVTSIGATVPCAGAQYSAAPFLLPHPSLLSLSSFFDPCFTFIVPRGLGLRAGCPPARAHIRVRMFVGDVKGVQRARRHTDPCEGAKGSVWAGEDVCRRLLPCSSRRVEAWSSRCWGDGMHGGERGTDAWHDSEAVRARRAGYGPCVRAVGGGACAMPRPPA